MVAAVRATFRPEVTQNFVGRDDILRHLCDKHFVASRDQSGRPRVSILHGMGGAGKTQIAVRFAGMYEARYGI